mmetsp:Transcript_119724/g.382139  ORF Transcript_119724/g.382139 Transcript_119724/m.382139 type:complete len:356 (+) Transcript_119724:175-1242(+)
MLDAALSPAPGDVDDQVAQRFLILSHPVGHLALVGHLDRGSVFVRQQVLDEFLSFCGLAVIAVDTQQVACAILLLELLHGALGDLPASGEDHELVAQLLCLFEHVRGQEAASTHGHDLVDGGPNSSSGDRIQARRGLVEDCHSRRSDHGAAHGEAPAHAATEGVRHPVPLVLQAHRRQDPLHAALRLGTHSIPQKGEEAEVLLDGEVPIDARLLGAQADAGAPEWHVDGHTALARALLSGDAPDGRRLPAAVRAQEPKHGAGHDAEADVAEDVLARGAGDPLQPAIPMHQSLDLQHRTGGGARCAAAQQGARVVQRWVLAAVQPEDGQPSELQLHQDEEHEAAEARRRREVLLHV